MEEIKLPKPQTCEVYNIHQTGLSYETIDAIAEICDDLTFSGDGRTLVSLNDVLFALSQHDDDSHTEETRVFFVVLTELQATLPAIHNTYIGF